MNISIPLPEATKQRLAQAFGSDQEAERVAELAAAAGAMEVLAQASGEAVFSSVADLRSFRIFCLLQQGMTLAEAERIVALIFKIPARSARTMVNKALARYSMDIRPTLRAFTSDTLDSAVWDEEDEKWRVELPSQFMREQLLDLASSLDVPSPTSVPRGSQWAFPHETYNAVRTELGLCEREKP